MKIQHDTNEDGGRFYVERDGSVVGELNYTLPAADRIDAVRTFVDPSMRGTGAALSLVQALMAHAEAEGREIIPTCWYVAKVLNRTPKSS